MIRWAMKVGSITIYTKVVLEMMHHLLSTHESHMLRGLTHMHIGLGTGVSR